MQEQKLLSVGIDIGTSTTQLVFSEIKIQNSASAFSVPRMEICDKKILYKSDIHFTPLKSDTEIDSEGVLKIIKQEYEKAGYSVREPDTGAVIITGETARKENARAVLQMLSDFSGDFVVATAGADLESVLSGKGAGTDVISEEFRTACANFDIGGGTTNISVFSRGEIKDTACFDIGGRLIRYDQNKVITYITPKVKKIIEEEHLEIQKGRPLNLSELDKLLDIFVLVLQDSLKKDHSKYFGYLMTHKGLEETMKISHLTFSGGVAEGIYNPEKDPYSYGDIGIFLGRKIKDSPFFSNFTVVRPKETIRATVVGAGSHATKISGSTVYYNEELLPLKSLPVIKLTENYLEEYRKKRDWFDKSFPVAISIEGFSSPSYSELLSLAKDICKAVRQTNEPLILVSNKDMGKALGYALKSILPERQIISIDSIFLKDGDYIDIGSPIMGGMILPVVVKTILFQ